MTPSKAESIRSIKYVVYIRCSENAQYALVELIYLFLFPYLSPASTTYLIKHRQNLHLIASSAKYQTKMSSDQIKRNTDYYQKGLTFVDFM